MLIAAVESEKKPSTRVFHTLDGMRGVAALAVFAFHSEQLLGFANIPKSGYLAVDLFFMLSGVVISRSYGHRLEANLGLLEFLKIRLIRFYPLYFLGLVLSIGAIVAGSLTHHATIWHSNLAIAESFGLSLLFLPQPTLLTGAGTLFPLNSPYWSLLFELIINVVYAVSIAVWTRRVLLCAIGLAALLLLYTDYYFGSLAVGQGWPTILGGLPRVIYSFAVGVMISRLNIRRTEMTLAALAILAAVLLMLFATPDATSRPFYDFICVAILFPVIVILGIRFEPSERLIPTFKFFGVASYGIYVLHAPMNSIIGGLLHVFGIRYDSLVPGIGLGVGSVVVISVFLIDRYYDAPLRRALLKALRRP